MITTSITLTGFVIRQRKNNRMIGELVAQTKVEYGDRYSNMGVGVQNQAYVSKCPACAEWIKIEAKVCKSCQNDVDTYNLNLREAMQELDVRLSEAKIAEVAANKMRLASNKVKRRNLYKRPIFKVSLGLFLVVVITLVGFRVNSILNYNKLTSMPSSASELAKSWNLIIEGCQLLTSDGQIETVPEPSSFESNYVSLTVALPRQWEGARRAAISCFSQKAFGFDVFEKIKGKRFNAIKLRNNFVIQLYEKEYLSDGRVVFRWNR